MSLFEHLVITATIVWLVTITICVWLLMKCSREALRRIQRLEHWSYRDSVYGLINSLFFKLIYTEDIQKRIDIMKRIHELVEELEENKKPQSEGRHN